MATHSSVLAWRIPGTGEPGGLPSMGSHRVQHDWSDLAAAAAAAAGYHLTGFITSPYLQTRFWKKAWHDPIQRFSNTAHGLQEGLWPGVLTWASASSSGLPWWFSGKEPAYQYRRREFDPWVGKIPWRKAWQPTPVFLPGEPHGPRSLAGYGP